MSLRMLIAARLREARRSMNLNQTQAADLIGVSQSNWAAYETGRASVPIDTLELICKRLNKPIEFFVVADYEYLVKGAVPKGETPKKARSKRDAPKEPAHR